MRTLALPLQSQEQDRAAMRGLGAAGRGQDFRDSGRPGRAGDPAGRGASFSTCCMCRESPVYEMDVALGHAGGARQRRPRAGGLPEDPGRLLITAAPAQRADVPAPARCPWCWAVVRVDGDGVPCALAGSAGAVVPWDLRFGCPSSQ